MVNANTEAQPYFFIAHPMAFGFDLYTIQTIE